jgi:hypothetical protein
MLGYVVGIIGQVVWFLMSISAIPNALNLSQGTQYAIWTACFVSLIAAMLTFYVKKLRGKSSCKRSSFFLFSSLAVGALAIANQEFQILNYWTTIGLLIAGDVLLVALVASARADDSVEGPKRAKTALVLLVLGVLLTVLWLFAPGLPVVIGSFSSHFGLLLFIVSMFKDDPTGSSGGGGSYYSGGSGNSYYTYRYTYTYTVTYWHPN